MGVNYPFFSFPAKIQVMVPYECEIRFGFYSKPVLHFLSYPHDNFDMFPKSDTCLCFLFSPQTFWPADKMPSIQLQSSDGEVFKVDIEIAKQSVTIKTMLEDLGMEEDEEEPVPLPNVNAAILKRVIQW